MPRFNFNAITKSGKADIDKIGENFEEIEENGITEAEVDAKVGQDNFRHITREQNNGNEKFDIYIIRRGKIVTMHVSISIAQLDSLSSSTITLLSTNASQSYPDMQLNDWNTPSNDYKISENQLFIPLSAPVFDSVFQNTAAVSPTSYIRPYIRIYSGEMQIRVDWHKIGNPVSGLWYSFNFSFSYAVD